MIDYKKQKLLVIAPHPDDEVIGCGALIAKIKRGGGKVFVLFLTVGDTQDFSKKGLSTSVERIKEIKSVAEYLGFDGYDIAFPDNDRHLQLDKYGQKNIMDAIERKSKVSIEKIKPTIVAFPSVSSYNQDHQIAAKASHAAVRPSGSKHKHMVDTVLAYEEAADTWKIQQNTDVNFFIQITKKEIETKLKALSLYKSQMRNAPNLRSLKILEALAILRGGQSGSHFAEGYISYRVIF